METDGASFMTLIMAIGAGLSGAVTVLFKIVMKQADEQVKFSKQIGHLEGKHDGITQLSDRVLEVVHQATTSPDDRS